MPRRTAITALDGLASFRCRRGDSPEMPREFDDVAEHDIDVSFGRSVGFCRSVRLGFACVRVHSPRGDFTYPAFGNLRQHRGIGADKPGPGNETGHIGCWNLEGRSEVHDGRV